jgi:hypothetical protein
MLGHSHLSSAEWCEPQVSILFLSKLIAKIFPAILFFGQTLVNTLLKRLHALKNRKNGAFKAFYHLKRCYKEILTRLNASFSMSCLPSSFFSLDMISFFFCAKSSFASMRYVWRCQEIYKNQPGKERVWR